MKRLVSALTMMIVGLLAIPTLDAATPTVPALPLPIQHETRPPLLLPSVSDMDDDEALYGDEALQNLKNAIMAVDPKAQITSLWGRRGVAFAFSGGRALAEWRPAEVRLMCWYIRKVPFDKALALVNQWNCNTAGGRAWAERVNGVSRFCLATDAHLQPPIDLKSIVKIMGASTLLGALSKNYVTFIDQALKTR